jgi:hypothetical protein
MPHIDEVCAFKRVSVIVTPSNDKLIEWRLHSKYRYRSNCPEIYIEVARTGGEWCRLNPDVPLSNTCMFIDSTKYRCNKQNDISYRVVMIDGAFEVTSHPEPIMGLWNRRDIAIARDIIRKEYLRFRYVASDGFLLKVREHGEPCETCMDFDTETPIKSSCPECFGTKFKKGYYNAVEFPVDLSGTTSQRDVQLPLGTTDNKQRLGRAIAYPRLDPYDVWVDAVRNKRYIIRKVTTAAELKGKPLIYQAEFHELPASAVEFCVPLEQFEGTSSTSACLVTPGGWRTGISLIEL